MGERVEQATRIEYKPNGGSGTEKRDDTAFIVPGTLYVDAKRDRIGLRMPQPGDQRWEVPLSDVLTLLRKAAL